MAGGSTLQRGTRLRQSSSSLLVFGVAAAAAVSCLSWTRWAFVGGSAGRSEAPSTRSYHSVVPRHAESAATDTATETKSASKCPFHKDNMKMEGAPDVDADGLIQGERYIAMNRFMVREGSEAQFETRWATRKSSLLQLDGFRWFSLMRRVPGDKPIEYDDEFSYVSFTIWETKKNFNAWRSGPAFKEAHGGGSPFDFFAMIINGFMTSKGPPKPAFWRSMLMEKTSEEKERLLSGPGGRPDADGSKILDPEVFVSMNRFTVAEGKEREFEQIWANRESKLKDLPGFRFFQLMRRDQTPDDDVNYISMAAWDDREAFNNWRDGDSFKKAHGGAKKPEGGDGAEGDGGAAAKKPAGGPMGGILVKPPVPYFYEAKLVLESEQGA
eukprot:TRINITY_DN31376_c0_g1_i1.p1 TRINITY_DN31376_c0_g1~~TRINITY_DN31376_c0_g1_i1.p1  ORF type:complete len:383 (-),score=97.57 TRINITY_DN31376_c0_g1_i1:202-1350(-)